MHTAIDQIESNWASADSRSDHWSYMCATVPCELAAVFWIDFSSHKSIKSLIVSRVLSSLSSSWDFHNLSVPMNSFSPGITWGSLIQLKNQKMEASNLKPSKILSFCTKWDFMIFTIQTMAFNKSVSYPPPKSKANSKKQSIDRIV